jgi:hypothetical protein
LDLDSVLQWKQLATPTMAHALTKRKQSDAPASDICVKTLSCVEILPQYDAGQPAYPAHAGSGMSARLDLSKAEPH